MRSHLITRLIWQYLGGEGADRRPHRRLVLQRGFEGEPGWTTRAGKGTQEAE